MVIELKPGTITSAPALGLPDLAKPFTLYVTEEDKVVMGVLSQTMGTRDRPVAYLPKWLDSVAAGWPGCLQAIAVVALLAWEATKLTSGQDLFAKILHEVNTLLRGDPHKWLSTSVIYCQGHQKEDTPQVWGNRLADKTAKQADKQLNKSGSDK